MLCLPAIPGNPYLRRALWVSKGPILLQSSREQQKCVSALASGQRVFRFRSMFERTSQYETGYPGQRKPGRTRPSSDEARATHPLTHRVSRRLNQFPDFLVVYELTAVGGGKPFLNFRPVSSRASKIRTT
jgi:hypothetical protein